MSSTLLTLVNQLLCRTGQTEALTIQNASTPTRQAVLFLNETMQEMVEKVSSYHFLKKGSVLTTSGTADYNVPADTTVQNVLSETLLLLPGQQPLQEMDAASLNLTSGVQGIPKAFYRAGEKIHLHPVPNATYTIHFDYLFIPRAMAADSDSCELPASWETALLNGAQSRLERFLGEPYQDSYLLYIEGLLRLKTQTGLKTFNRMRGYYKGNS